MSYTNDERRFGTVKIPISAPPFTGGGVKNLGFPSSSFTARSFRTITFLILKRPSKHSGSFGSRPRVWSSTRIRAALQQIVTWQQLQRVRLRQIHCLPLAELSVRSEEHTSELQSQFHI